MKFGIRLAACAAAALLMTTGCASVGLQNNKAEVPEKPPQKRVGLELLEAFFNNDAEAFRNQFPEETRGDISEKDFEQTRKAMLDKLGKPVSYEFVTNLEQPNWTVSIWKILFERDSADKTKKIRRETFFRAVAGELDGKMILLNQSFFPEDVADWNAAKLQHKQKAPEAAQKPAGEILLKAFADNDAKAFLKQLPDRLREQFGEKDFEQTRKSMLEKLGKLVSYQFVTNLEHPAYTVSLWKVRFERDNFARTKKIHQETMFRAVTTELNGKEVLLGFHFF